MESLTDDQRALFVKGGHLNDYDVLKPIGKGKFSIVFKAKRRHDGQAVALKKIAIFDMMNLKAREKTLKEVRLVQSVRHPNIIQYLDAFIQNNELYIAFEWAEAGDLKRQIRKANEKGVRFDERTIWRYFTQLCGAIRYLHEARIMHRDLKPANIFLTLKGIVKVGDLGLGRHLSENTVEARSKVGTPLYMSPEVLRGESYDWKSDVWSLGCILYELAMLRSPFKSEGLNLAGLFQKINKGYYEAIPEVYSDHLHDLVKRMISLIPSDRPSIQQVWEFCRTRPSSAILHDRVRYRQTDRENNPDTTDFRARNGTKDSTPEDVMPPRSSSSSDQQHQSSPQSCPPSSQKDASNEAIEELSRRKHAETRMEVLFERLKILKYERILCKCISPTYFAFDCRKDTLQSRYEDMCKLSSWLISLLGGESCDWNEGPRIASAQKILLAAEEANVSGVGHLSAPALVNGIGIEVCELLDALTAAVVNRKHYCAALPEYPIDPVATLESCDALDATDDEQQSESNDRISASATLLGDEDEDEYAHWLVVRESPSMVNDQEKTMIYTNVDPVAWELERRRILPKLQAVLSDKLQRYPSESSWRVRLSQVQSHAQVVIADKDHVQRDIGEIQACRQKQTEQVERYEKQLNIQTLRARRLYHEGTTLLAKSQNEMLSVQESVNQATVEVASLQVALSKQANALKAAEARATDNSILLERKRQLRHLVDENRDLGLKLQVLHDYWSRKQNQPAIA